jgi:hypothetical protein
MKPAPNLSECPQFQALAVRADAARRLAAFADQNAQHAAMNLELAKLASARADAAALEAYADLETYRRNFFADARAN